MDDDHRSWTCQAARQVVPGLSEGLRRYDSRRGPPSHLQGSALQNLTVGRNIARDLSVSLMGLNVTNRRLLTDNSLSTGT